MCCNQVELVHCPNKLLLELYLTLLQVTYILDKVNKHGHVLADVAVRVGAVPNSMMGQQQGPSFFSPQQPCQQSSSVGQMQGGHTSVSRPSNYATQCVSMFSNPLLSQGMNSQVTLNFTCILQGQLHEMVLFCGRIHRLKTLAKASVP